MCPDRYGKGRGKYGISGLRLYYLPGLQDECEYDFR